MLSEIIFIVATVVVLMISVLLIKKFAPVFFEKISKFVPLLVAVIAFIASAIFYLITVKKVELIQSAIFAYFIASAEVYTYEGIYKLFTKAIRYFKQTKEDVKEAVAKKGE